MAEPEKSSVTVTFQLAGDQFAHAWFFNRFRVDRIGNSKLITLALMSDSGVTLAVNGFVISDNDLMNNRERAVVYLGDTASETSTRGEHILSFSAPPARVYPVNHINLARIDQTGETGLFRYSVHTLIDQMRESRKTGGVKPALVNCYPVVLFRSDLSVQNALIKEIYTE